MKTILTSVLILLVPSAVRGSEIELPEIMAHLKKWRESFVDLHVKWQHTEAYNTEQNGSGKDSPFGSCRSEWFWSERGLQLCENTSLFRKIPTRTLEVCNPPESYAFRADFIQDPDRGELCKELKSWLLTPTLSIGSLIDKKPLRGLVFQSIWLHEYIEQFDVEIEGTEDIDGTPCVKLSASERDREKFKVWLDSNRGFIVKKFAYPRRTENSSIYEFIVDEYEELDEGIWFPKKGTMIQADLYIEWLVTDVDINTGIEESRLDFPALNIGTLVYDQAGRGHRVTSEQDRRTIREKLINDPQQYLAQVEANNASKKKLPPLLRWSLSLLIAALIVFLISKFSSRRRRGLS